MMITIIMIIIMIMIMIMIMIIMLPDRLVGLVVSMSDYSSLGRGLDPRYFQTFLMWIRSNGVHTAS